jgi:hypothetical protein
VSHYQERKEKNCLNCNAEVAGRFCQVCGQENIEPKESFWTLATHFLHDMTHFDGKFFSTLKYLLFKPSFLSKEYLKGRRASYLHPIRMYVFTSFIFFLIFFNFYQKAEDLNKIDVKKPVAEDIKRLKEEKSILEKTISKLDTADLGMSLDKAKLKVQQLNNEIVAIQKDSTKRDSIINANFNFVEFGGIHNDSLKANSISQYDSLQKTLPDSKKDRFFRASLIHQWLHLKEKFKNDENAMWKAIFERYLHLFPQMLFVSLPFFALILQLLYVRRKQLYYVNHVVFTIHLYCGTFILILASLLLGSLFKVLHMNLVAYEIIAFFIILFYWYKSFRNFYIQSRKKTIFKFIILFFMTMIMMSILFLLFIGFSAFLI